jgi:hypothetical protein
MFCQPARRFISALLAASLALMSALASAETHDDSHAHSQQAVSIEAGMPDDVESHGHDLASESDCGLGECVTCHLFCHSCALLTGNSAISAWHAVQIAFHLQETPLPFGLSDRIERPNW